MPTSNRPGAPRRPMTEEEKAAYVESMDKLGDKLRQDFMFAGELGVRAARAVADFHMNPKKALRKVGGALLNALLGDGDK